MNKKPKDLEVKPAYTGRYRILTDEQLIKLHARVSEASLSWELAKDRLEEDTKDEVYKNSKEKTEMESLKKDLSVIFTKIERTKDYLDDVFNYRYDNYPNFKELIKTVE